MTVLVPTEDGRSLEVLDTGPADALPLVYHHGTPQGAVPFPTLERAAAAEGLRVVSYSRPGYGASTPRPDGATTATVADDAVDTAAVLDHLGIGEFLTIGWSGGGPRALACAAMLPGRCLAAACCVGIAPAADYDGDIRDGMAEENVDEYTAVFAGVEALESFLDIRKGFFGVTPDQVAEGLGALAPPVDRAALTEELTEYLAASVNAAGRQGIVGWRDDDLTHTRPWGFDLSEISTPVSIWQGSLDTMVPFAHARWLAANAAGAQSHLIEGEGHISLMSRVPDILDDLRRLGGVFSKG
ncbi:alpha/beta fold hydrolase [Rhodococcus sp. IEGM 1374]|uniref:alpha/beta fold hydrolase n=1 Tax=Rhodococcus sp. IEGM 1374 TaxID=3082221 RepID=UPI00295473F1|nr:alpha/beta fold hydrolase [Rhodococcus sp. IEGM 1374]MDV7991516.1 alpha/beta fold hydrolase [Rhodococcus sp. IEGM 1374]